MRSFSAGWILFIFARNFVLLVLFFGAFHLRLYIRKAQGTRFKYNAKWLDTASPRFLFGNQTVDNMIWSLGSALPIWTAYEVLTLWLFANGYIPFIGIDQHPIYFFVLLLLIPLFRELHFYAVHRLIHWPPLYHAVHKLHHNNVNPGPWSGLAMHPVEHLLYFSGVSSTGSFHRTRCTRFITSSTPDCRPPRAIPVSTGGHRRGWLFRYRILCPLSPPPLFRVQLCRRHRAARQMVRHLSRWIRCGPSRDEPAPRREPQRFVRLKQLEEAI